MAHNSQIEAILIDLQSMNFFFGDKCLNFTIIPESIRSDLVSEHDITGISKGKSCLFLGTVNLICRLVDCFQTFVVLRRLLHKCPT